MKHIKLIFLILILWQWQACSRNQDDIIRVAVSANAQHAIASIVDEFTKDTNIEVDIIVGSSGKLTAQIQQGAPFDIFISADQSYPQALFEKGISNQPKIYAYGSLVYWTTNPKVSILSTNLDYNSIKRIAIPNSHVAPYGKAAVHALHQLGHFEALQDKFIFGENVSQVNQFILTGNTDVGITSKSSMYLSDLKDVGHWVDIPIDNYDKIKQAAVVIHRDQNHKNLIEQFYKFLDSKKSQRIFSQFGYTLPDQ